MFFEQNPGVPAQAIAKSGGFVLAFSYSQVK